MNSAGGARREEEEGGGGGRGGGGGGGGGRGGGGGGKRKKRRRRRRGGGGGSKKEEGGGGRERGTRERWRQGRVKEVEDHREEARGETRHTYLGSAAVVQSTALSEVLMPSSDPLANGEGY